MGDHFEFMLDHKASYLCFLPRVTNAALAPNVYLTKIVVKSDNAIAGDYTLSLAGLNATPTANAATEITLTTQGAAHVNGFPLPTATSVATNAAYMVIAPGTHSLTVDYYIKDPVTGVEGFITKTLPVDKNYEANKVYDVTANLTPKDYSDQKFYMWDAQEDYWHGVADAPTLNGQLNNNYPKTSTDPRWHSTESFPIVANRSCQTCPNVNELFWYSLKGDPHWDDKTIWSTMGHLYKGGMWFKKKENIAFENGVTTASMKTAYNSIDYRAENSWFISNNNSVGNVSSLSNTSNYFYLPALGFCYEGSLYYVGLGGYYWMSSPTAFDNTKSYSMRFYYDHIDIDVNVRSLGAITWTFE